MEWSADAKEFLFFIFSLVFNLKQIKMNCCGAHSGSHERNQSSIHTSNVNEPFRNKPLEKVSKNSPKPEYVKSQDEKKVSWFWVIIVLLFIGMLVFSILA